MPDLPTSDEPATAPLRLSRRRLARAAAVVAPVAAVSALGGGEAQASVPTSWQTTGDAGTSSSTNFLGTTDGVSLVIRTNNTEAMRITPAHEVGIGTTAPAATLHVAASAGPAVLGVTAAAAAAAVAGTSSSTSAGAVAVSGVLTASAPGTGAMAVSGAVTSTGATGIAVAGAHSGGGTGVAASSVSGPAISATSGTGTAIVATATGASAVSVISATNPATADNVSAISATLSASGLGTGCAAISGHVTSTGANGTAVLGAHAGSGKGINGTSNGGIGVNAVSNSGTALVATSTTGTGATITTGGSIGLQVTTTSSSADQAVFGYFAGSGSAVNSSGVTGMSAGSGDGVYGYTVAGIGVSASSDKGTGLRATSVTGPAFIADTSGSASDATNIPGLSVTAATGDGITGLSTGADGVVATATGTGGSVAISAIASGNTPASTAVIGIHSYAGFGVYGEAQDAGYTSGSGSSVAVGVIVSTPFRQQDYDGPEALGDLANALNASTESGTGLLAICKTGTALHAFVDADNYLGGGDTEYADNEYAGYFNGPVLVNGDVTMINGSTGAAHLTVVDDPRSASDSLLSRAVVASPELLRICRGRAVLDAAGAATVTLPAVFLAVTTQLSYLLTAVGSPMPGLHVSRRADADGFGVAGGTPDGTICWQVSGVRSDPYALSHPLLSVTAKAAGEQGRYLYPRGSGADADQAMTPRTAVPRPVITRSP